MSLAISSGSEVAAGCATSRWHTHAMGPKEGDKWAAKEKTKVDQLPDGPDKNALLKMLAHHQGKGWTAEQAAVFDSHLTVAQRHAKSSAIADGAKLATTNTAI
jgi:hypothetical protein